MRCVHEAEGQRSYLALSVSQKESNAERLEEENQELRDQMDQFVEEFTIVDWYIKVMESGKNTKNLLKDYIESQEEIKSLKDEITKLKARFEKKLNEKNDKIRTLGEQLVKTQNNVVKPLISEVKVLEALKQRLLKQQDTNAKDLKMLYSIIKIPRLCDEFQRALRRKNDEERRAAYELKSMNYIQPKMSQFKSTAGFFDNVVGYIERIYDANKVQPDQEERFEIDSTGAKRAVSVVHPKKEKGHLNLDLNTASGSPGPGEYTSLTTNKRILNRKSSLRRQSPHAIRTNAN